MEECLAGVKQGPTIDGRRVIRLGRPFPFMGHIAFGVIERGTNVIQVRPSTLCFHDCVFCSVDAGLSSRTRHAEYIIDDIDWLVDWVRAVVDIKGGGVEALIDGVGEPLSNPHIAELVRKLKSISGVERIAIETHGGSLSVPLIKALEKAGLDRVNLSVDAMDPGLARRLVNVSWYDVGKILATVERALLETRVDFILTPVIVPGYNEGEMLKLIEWAKAHRLGERSGWPSGVLVQKYEAHRFGRRPKGVVPWSWEYFYKFLRRLERETGYRLLLRPDEIGIRRAPRVERPFRKGDEVNLVIAGDGWLLSELLAVDPRCSRVITVIKAKRGLDRGIVIRGSIIRDEDNIYLARPVLA
ncbi:MAG: radical SAM protein [Acidilobus sp.]